MKHCKAVAVIQSNYIPWKGYFDVINLVDEFILFDEVQFTKRDWRNRNKIKTPSGVQWLTIPVITKSKFDQPIDHVEIAGSWVEKHWRSIEHNYRQAPGYKVHGPQLQAIYEACEKHRLLSDINVTLLRGICKILGIATPIKWSRDYAGEGRRTDRLLAICMEAGATRYLSGPAARAYLNTETFEAAGIEVKYMSYDGYPAYPQLYGSFDHFVSIVDLLMNTGDRARDFMKSFS